jgi:hypothetical protein
MRSKVLDGVFVAADDIGNAVNRLTASVAPGMSSEDILALRQRIDAAFLPRPYLVARLPRNILGNYRAREVMHMLADSGPRRA